MCLLQNRNFSYNYNVIVLCKCVPSHVFAYARVNEISKLLVFFSTHFSVTPFVCKLFYNKEKLLRCTNIVCLLWFSVAPLFRMCPWKKAKVTRDESALQLCECVARGAATCTQHVIWMQSNSCNSKQPREISFRISLCRHLLSWIIQNLHFWRVF